MFLPSLFMALVSIDRRWAVVFPFIISLLVNGYSTPSRSSSGEVMDGNDSIESDSKMMPDNNWHAPNIKSLQQSASLRGKQPRRKTLSANIREYKYAAYFDAWRSKVQAIGNLNYPKQATQDKQYGCAVIRVAVKADGSVESTHILRSTGHKRLDNAAIQILHLATPFEPFPDSIRVEADILDIIRTWCFQPGK
jgi:TonB family protein